MQLPLVATLTLNWFAVGIAYFFEKAAKEKAAKGAKEKAAKAAKEKAAKEKAAKEKAAKEKAAKKKAAKEKAAKEKAAKEKWERERPAREKAEMKIATKLGVAVDKIVSKSLFCFCSFFSSYFFAFFVLHVLFLPCGFVLLLSILTFFSVHILLLIYFSLLSYNRSLFTQGQISFRKDTTRLLKKD